MMYAFLDFADVKTSLVQASDDANAACAETFKMD